MSEHRSSVADVGMAWRWVVVTSVGPTLSKAVAALREHADETISAEDFVELLSELEIREKVNFVEGELKAGDLAARIEVVQATAVESEADIPTSPAKREAAPLTVSYSASETMVDPWRRTVSQLSLGTALEPEVSGCRIEVIAGDTVGPFYDRHRVYLISVPSQVCAQMIIDGAVQDVQVGRRYKDFEWLHGILLHKYPFRIVPSIPGKRISVAMNDEFIATRRRGLEEFMILILSHPILQKDPLVAEFLTAESFGDVRSRVHPAWEEEFATSEHSNGAGEGSGGDVEGGAHIVGEPNWVTYDDATKWSLQVTGAVKGIIWSLLELAKSSSDSQAHLRALAEHTKTVLGNTQHTETGATNVPAMLLELAEPHERYAEGLKGCAQKLELFLQLIAGCRDMVLRTKRMKFNHFASLNDQIVSAQAHAEKLRVRDGPAPSADQEKALRAISALQRDLLYQSRRNEFADACLRHELGWVIKMTRGMPGIFENVQSVLQSHARTLNGLLSGP